MKLKDLCKVDGACKVITYDPNVKKFKELFVDKMGFNTCLLSEDLLNKTVEEMWVGGRTLYIVVEYEANEC